MGKLDVMKIIKGVQLTTAKHAPEILTGIGIAGMVTTVVLAVKATPKAMLLISEKKETLKVDKLTGVETVKTAWKCYIPTAIIGISSVACLIGASSVNLRRNAALAAAYTLSDTALREYRDKVSSTIGEKKEKAIREQINEDRLKKDPVSKKEVLITGGGNTLCYDIFSGRYFKSDIEQIKKAENEINSRLLNDMYVSLNDFYDILGLAHAKMGDQLGWSIDDGLIEFDFGSHLADDGTPCLAVEYDVAPKYGFDSFN